MSMPSPYVLVDENRSGRKMLTWPHLARVAPVVRWVLRFRMLPVLAEPDDLATIYGQMSACQADGCIFLTSRRDPGNVVYNSRRPGLCSDCAAVFGSRSYTTISSLACELQPS